MSEWTQTLELRRFDDTDKLTSPRLQQRWINIAVEGAPEYEWRDVPLVWEPRRQSAPEIHLCHGNERT